MTVRVFLSEVYHRVTGRYLTIKKTITTNSLWYGSEYGGFYVCPDDLDDNSIVYSFGIGEDISFDLDLIRHHNCKVFGFDPTPKSIKWIGQQQLPSNFQFFPFGIGKVTGMVKFFMPRNDEHVSGSMVQNKNTGTRTIDVLLKSFEDIGRELKHRRIDILKMDIEGAEYEVLPKIVESNVEIRQILIEFHHRSVSNGKELSEKAILLLKSCGYGIFDVSETGEEVSFIKLK